MLNRYLVTDLKLSDKFCFIGDEMELPGFKVGIKLKYHFANGFGKNMTMLKNVHLVFCY